MLYVHRRDHGDAGVEEILNVLIALFMCGSRGVGVGQLVDQCHLRMPRDYGFGIHLLEDHALVSNLLWRNHLQLADLFGCVWSSMSFDETDDDVGASSSSTICLLKGHKRLAHARRRS